MEHWIDFVMPLSSKMTPIWKARSMSVSDNYRTYIVEQLAALPALSTRRMFGGLGIYSDAWFFALIDDDVLFFKVDDSNRDDYVSRGMKAFMPFPGQPSLGYFQVPPDVIEEAEELARWARRSVDVAKNKKGPQLRSRRPSSRKKRS
jgi:DNA transformation protein and related proteins